MQGKVVSAMLSGDLKKEFIRKTQNLDLSISKALRTAISEWLGGD